MPLQATHPLLPFLGKALFIFNEVYTNQVIYSLYRVMKSTHLKQLAFVGKQSVPAALRKDRWRPLACVHFPSPSFGLSTLRLLREFRTMHETQYDKKILNLPKTERKSVLQNQKANSVADLAIALQMELDRLENDQKRTGVAEIMVKWQDMGDGNLVKKWPSEVIHQQGERPDRYAFSKQDLPPEMQMALSQPPLASTQSRGRKVQSSDIKSKKK